MFESQFK
jgi:hypothetical protein